MPFLDHLEELRWRIIWSLLAVVVSVAAGFFLVLHFDVLAIREQPILPFLHGHHVMATHPTDGLQLTISAAMWIGCVGAFPVVLYQTWLFLAPALYVRERRLLIAALFGGIVLFVIGAAFAWFVMLPMSLPWLFTMFGRALEPMITAENYFGFVFSMVLSFGLAFELPVVILLLAAAGLVTHAQSLSPARGGAHRAALRLPHAGRFRLEHARHVGAAVSPVRAQRRRFPRGVAPSSIGHGECRGAAGADPCASCAASRDVGSARHRGSAARELSALETTS